MTIKGLIFDFDGLIIDTEMPIFLSWQAVFQQHGCELPLDLWADSVGSTPDLFNPAGYLQNLIGESFDQAELTRLQNVRSLTIINEQAALPGVEAYLQAAKELGLQLAVASSSEDEWVYPHLARIGLTHYFDFICTSDNVERVKPAPDLFLCALQQMGLQPYEALIFEDSLNGIHAAHAAGCAVVAVPNEVTRMLDLSPADLVIPSMQSIPLTELLKNFN
jgi:HAD superfamily hydrolase (TIGR01509 family)